MDLVLDICDDLFLDRVWAHVVPVAAAINNANANASVVFPIVSTEPSSSTQWSELISLSSSQTPRGSAWPRNYVPRQLVSLFTITWIGIIVLYFVTAGLSYRCIFNHDMMRHPRFLKNQVKLEIQHSLSSFPWMTLLTLPWFQAEVMGYSRLYDDVGRYGWPYLILSVFMFLFFTDIGVYFVHRGLHHPLLYKTFHKPHHKWLVPTPFASHAFHPVDGYLQSVPYHTFIFVFPLHRVLYLGLFVFVNFWSIFIHDSDMITDHPLEKIVNGPAHHTLHHLYFTVNYGQYFTLADRVGNSYRQPDKSLDPLLEVQAADKRRKEKKQ